MESDIEGLMQRIGRLERDNRRLKRIGVVTSLAVVTALCMGQARTSRTLDAEKILVHDSQGRVRIAIGTPEFLGAAVDMRPDAPAIWLANEKGIDQVILTTDGLRLGSTLGKPLVELSTQSPIKPALRFYGKDGKIEWSTP